VAALPGVASVTGGDGASSAAGMDPLSLVRAAHLRHEEIRQDGENIVVGNHVFHGKTPTTYKTLQGKGDSFYTIEEIYGFLTVHSRFSALEEVPYSLYLKECQKLPKVSFVDRKDLFAYLRGDIDTCASIQFVVDAQFPEPVGKADAAGTRETPGAAQVAPFTPQQVMAREIPLRDRNSVLVSSKKDFRSVLEFLKDFRRKEVKTIKRRQEDAVKDGAKPSRYQRPTDEKQIWKEQVGTDLEELGIKTNVYKRKADANASDPAASHRKRPASSSRPQANHNAPGKGIPIIMMPPGFNGLLMMYNAREFLEQGRFVTWQQKKVEKGDDDIPKNESIIIRRKLGRSSPVPYQVMNNATALKDRDWERVVAVFTDGASWQFRKWPNEKDKAKIFDMVCGFHLGYEEEASKAESLRSWNIKTLVVRTS